MLVVTLLIADLPRNFLLTCENISKQPGNRKLYVVEVLIVNNNEVYLRANDGLRPWLHQKSWPAPVSHVPQTSASSISSSSSVGQSLPSITLTKAESGCMVNVRVLDVELMRDR
jgi:hypothetical protein